MTACRFLLEMYTIIVLISCRSISSENSVRPVRPDSTATAFNSNLIEAFPHFTKQVGIPTIEQGVDSFEYRLWCPVRDNTISLIRIRYVDSGWEISEIMVCSHMPKHDFRRNDNVNHLLETIVDSTRERRLKPNVSIDRFIDSLQYFNLQESPSNLELMRSTEFPSDSWRYTFEIADRKNYRIIEYNCGAVHSDRQFHQNIEGLFYFLKTQLKVNFKDCNHADFIAIDAKSN